MIKRVLAILFAVFLALTGVQPAFAAGTTIPSSPASPASPTVAPAPNPEPIAPVRAQRGGSFVSAAVNRVGDAVVRIDTERTVTRNPDPFMGDPRLRRFFGDYGFSPEAPYEEHLQGQGSGFIIDGNGTILTNAHVVEGADRVTVSLKDGRKLQGEVQGVDEVTDLAVVKIPVKDGKLPTVALGDSDQVQVGDWAIAVGNPLGLDNTVTLGIVSTLNRPSSLVGIPDKRVDFIQTDAAINPGNSGGPLLNENGEVIGINTAIRANAMGIGFAIPINKAKEISPRLARGEKVSHPYIGVQIGNLTPELAKENNDNPNSIMLLPEVTGVLVAGVVPNSPAAAAGIRRGDVITQIDGKAIATADSLQGLVDRTPLGQALKLSLRRGDRTLQIDIRPAELNENT
jgi:S1-C subfamily serine protease